MSYSAFVTICCYVNVAKLVVHWITSTTTIRRETHGTREDMR